MGMRPARWAIIAALISGALLGGCREDEQDRVLSFEPGVYQGRKDTPLSADALERLRERGREQLGEQRVGLSGPPLVEAAPAAADTPPAASPAGGTAAESPAVGQSQPLNSRLRRQNF